MSFATNKTCAKLIILSIEDSVSYVKLGKCNKMLNMLCKKLLIKRKNFVRGTLAMWWELPKNRLHHGLSITMPVNQQEGEFLSEIHQLHHSRDDKKHGPFAWWVSGRLILKKYYVQRKHRPSICVYEENFNFETGHSQYIIGNPSFGDFNLKISKSCLNDIEYVIITRSPNLKKLKN